METKEIKCEQCLPENNQETLNESKTTETELSQKPKSPLTVTITDKINYGTQNPVDSKETNTSGVGYVNEAFLTEGETVADQSFSDDAQYDHHAPRLDTTQGKMLSFFYTRHFLKNYKSKE